MQRMQANAPDERTDGARIDGKAMPILSAHEGEIQLATRPKNEEGKTSVKSRTPRSVDDLAKQVVKAERNLHNQVGRMTNAFTGVIGVPETIGSAMTCYWRVQEARRMFKAAVRKARK